MSTEIIKKKRGGQKKDLKMTMVHIRMPDSLLDQIQEYAESKGLNASAVCRMWLKERIEQEKINKDNP